MIALVSDPWTRPEPAPAPETMLEHVRDVWTLHGIMSIATATIYRNVFGLELRTFRRHPKQSATDVRRLRDRNRPRAALAALCEDSSIRATVRMTGVAKNTVVKLLVELGAACSTYQDAVPTRSLYRQIIELFVPVE
jgi:hypothetical protein